MCVCVSKSNTYKIVLDILDSLKLEMKTVYKKKIYIKSFTTVDFVWNFSNPKHVAGDYFFPIKSAQILKDFHLDLAQGFILHDKDT